MNGARRDDHFARGRAHLLDPYDRGSIVLLPMLAAPLTFDDFLGLATIVIPSVTVIVAVFALVWKLRRKEVAPGWYLRMWGTGLLVGCLGGAVAIAIVRKPKANMAFFTKGQARQIAERASAVAGETGALPGAPDFVYNSEFGIGRGPDCDNARKPGRPYAPKAVKNPEARAILESLGITPNRPMRVQLTYALEEGGKRARITSLVNVSRSVAPEKCHGMYYLVYAPEEEGGSARVEGPRDL